MTNTATPANSRAAARLRAELAARQISRQDLAVRLGISPQSAGRRLTGEHDFRLTEIEQIADWLETPLTDLVGA